MSRSNARPRGGLPAGPEPRRGQAELPHGTGSTPPSGHTRAPQRHGNRTHHAGVRHRMPDTASTIASPHGLPIAPTPLLVAGALGELLDWQWDDGAPGALLAKALEGARVDQPTERGESTPQPAGLREIPDVRPCAPEQPPRLR